ncbi:hypothetical protein Q3G72_033594 [Acer saccharum]|nr:hypothetical protein Q3G72_033594 [Acer saccharum]
MMVVSRRLFLTLHPRSLLLELLQLTGASPLENTALWDLSIDTVKENRGFIGLIHSEGIATNNVDGYAFCSGRVMSQVVVAEEAASRWQRWSGGGCSLVCSGGTMEWWWLLLGVGGGTMEWWWLQQWKIWVVFGLLAVMGGGGEGLR